MATTNINGTSGRTGYDSIHGIDTALGRIDTGSPYGAITPEVMGVDVPLGRIDKGPNVGSISDRAPNLPSGIDLHGDVTFGDGKANRVTTWAEDRSGPNRLTKFTFATQSRPSGQLFTSLV